MYKNSIERNSGGSLEVTLPYVWSYNENYTHSVTLENNTWRMNRQFVFAVDGHYAQFNLSNNSFQNNTCKRTLNFSLSAFTKVTSFSLRIKSQETFLF